MDPRRRQLLRTAVGAPFAFGLAGCGGGSSSTSSSGAAGPVIRTGSSGIPSSISLTPQTVVVEDGARAITGVAADRKALRFAANQPIKPGSVVLLKDLGVFRAAAVEKAGNDLLVTPAACAITDVISDGRIRFDGVHVSPRQGRPKGAWLRGSAQSTSLFELLEPRAYAQGDDISGKIGDYDYHAQYTATDDAVQFSGEAGGDAAGVNVKLTASGHLSGFDVSGGVEVRRGAPESLALLVKSLVGEVNIEATAARHDNAGHTGRQMLKIPKEYVWPIVIDGIPFLLKLGVALLFNEGITNINASARFGAKLNFKGSSGFDMALPGDSKQADPKIEGTHEEEFSFTHADSVGLAAQALLVAMQYPRLAFGLGLDLPFVDVFAGPYIDIVTTASHTSSGATSLVQCQRNQLIVTGSVGLEGAFVKWSGDVRKEAYKKEIVRANPDSKACRLE
jgi:hypothetical protein